MSGREIPQLVFATRSPDPRSGSDFVRQVVAETAGVSEEARREFSRRADIAGSVLQYRARDAGQPRGNEPLRVFFFHPLSGGTWLFARAVSLGLYRKGSHQLLVHGVVLDEEALDGLEANPLALDTPRDVGFRLLDRHPGARGLAPLVLGPAAFEHARAHNRRALAETPAAEDAWIAAAYDALASGERAACVSAEPRPEAIERLLLHFHPDDRLEIGFSTFYAHGRQVEYRLIAVLPEDLAEARSQFRGLCAVDLAAPSPARNGLGELACKLRRSSLSDFRHAVDQALLTHLSQRRRQPLTPADASLVLRAGLDPGSLAAADRGRLEILYQRAGGGLGYLVAHLAAAWPNDPQELRRALDAAARADDKITREQLERYRDRRLDDSGEAQRWALAALLARPDALADDAALGDGELLRLWRRLLPRPMLDGLPARQMATAEDVLGRWALAHARAGDPADDPPDWAVVLGWLGERRRPTAGLAATLEAALADRQAADTPLTWRRLGDLLRGLGDGGAARRVFLGRELSLLSADEARRRVAVEVDRILAGGGLLAEFAPHLGRPGVARAVFGRLAGVAASRPDADPWPDLRRCLELADELDPGAAEAAGRLLAAVAGSPAAGSPAAGAGYGAWVLGRCRQLPPVRRRPAAFTATALAAAAASWIPVCEAALPDTDTERMVAAVADLLEIRGRHAAASGADRELMRLAVRGRVLAAAAAGGGEESAAARLDAAWRGFLRHASQGPAFEDPEPADAWDWLDLLQDEIFAGSAGKGGEDPVLGLFLHLAGRLQERQPPADLRDALAFKLRCARRLSSGGRRGRPPEERGEWWSPLPAKEPASKSRPGLFRRVRDNTGPKSRIR